MVMGCAGGGAGGGVVCAEDVVVVGVVGVPVHAPEITQTIASNRSVLMETILP